jgi:hypothetical protein
MRDRCRVYALMYGDRFVHHDDAARVFTLREALVGGIFTTTRKAVRQRQRDFADRFGYRPRIRVIDVVVSVVTLT